MHSNHEIYDNEFYKYLIVNNLGEIIEYYSGMHLDPPLTIIRSKYFNDKLPKNKFYNYIQSIIKYYQKNNHKYIKKYFLDINFDKKYHKSSYYLKKIILTNILWPKLIYYYSYFLHKCRYLHIKSKNIIIIFILKKNDD